MGERLRDGDVLELRRRHPAEGPSGRGQDQPVDDPGALTGDQLVQGRMLGVDRDHRRTRRLSERRHEFTADDQRFLVGEREIDSLAERGDGGEQPRRADDRVEHHVGPGLGDQRHEALRSREHLAVGPGLARPRRGVDVGERDPPNAMLAGLREQLLPVARTR